MFKDSEPEFTASNLFLVPILTFLKKNKKGKIRAGQRTKSKTQCRMHQRILNLENVYIER